MGDKVYVVMENDYEGSFLISVHRTQEGAEKHKEEMERFRASTPRVDFPALSVEIEEVLE